MNHEDARRDKGVRPDKVDVRLNPGQAPVLCDSSEPTSGNVHDRR